MPYGTDYLKYTSCEKFKGIFQRLISLSWSLTTKFKQDKYAVRCGRSLLSNSVLLCNAAQRIM